MLNYTGELGHLSMLEAMFEANILFHYHDGEGQAAIHRAIQAGHADVVNYLATLGEWNMANKDGLTPLHVCAGKL